MKSPTALPKLAATLLLGVVAVLFHSCTDHARGESLLDQGAVASLLPTSEAPAPALQAARTRSAADRATLADTWYTRPWVAVVLLILGSLVEAKIILWCIENNMQHDAESFARVRAEDEVRQRLAVKRLPLLTHDLDPEAHLA